MPTNAGMGDVSPTHVFQPVPSVSESIKQEQESRKFQEQEMRASSPTAEKTKTYSYGIPKRYGDAGFMQPAQAEVIKSPAGSTPPSARDVFTKSHYEPTPQQQINFREVLQPDYAQKKFGAGLVTAVKSYFKPESTKIPVSDKVIVETETGKREVSIKEASQLTGISEAALRHQSESYTKALNLAYQQKAEQWWESKTPQEKTFLHFGAAAISSPDFWRYGAAAITPYGKTGQDIIIERYKKELIKSDLQAEGKISGIERVGGATLEILTQSPAGQYLTFRTGGILAEAGTTAAASTSWGSPIAKQLAVRSGAISTGIVGTFAGYELVSGAVKYQTTKAETGSRMAGIETAAASVGSDIFSAYQFGKGWETRTLKPENPIKEVYINIRSPKTDITGATDKFVVGKSLDIGGYNVVSRVSETGEIRLLQRFKYTDIPESMRPNIVNVPLTTTSQLKFAETFPKIENPEAPFKFQQVSQTIRGIDINPSSPVSTELKSMGQPTAQASIGRYAKSPELQLLYGSTTIKAYYTQDFMKAIAGEKKLGELVMKSGDYDIMLRVSQPRALLWAEKEAGAMRLTEKGSRAVLREESLSVENLLGKKWEKAEDIHYRDQPEMDETAIMNLGIKYAQTPKLSKENIVIMSASESETRKLLGAVELRMTQGGTFRYMQNPERLKDIPTAIVLGERLLTELPSGSPKAVRLKEFLGWYRTEYAKGLNLKEIAGGKDIPSTPIKSSGIIPRISSPTISYGSKQNLYSAISRPSSASVKPSGASSSISSKPSVSSKPSASSYSVPSPISVSSPSPSKSKSWYSIVSGYSGSSSSSYYSRSAYSRSIFSPSIASIRSGGSSGDVGSFKLPKLKMGRLKKFKGRRGLLPDITSEIVSQLRYGKATEPRQTRAFVSKYEPSSALSGVPTKELMRGKGKFTKLFKAAKRLI